MSTEPQLQESKMGTMPVNKLLIQMALPMVISMLVQALYNIVDSIFVGRISEDAFTAVSLAFPVQTMLIALGTGTGVGVNAMLSKALGEKDYKSVNKAAANGIFLSLVCTVVFIFLGVFFSEAFFRSQTDNPVIIQHGVEYLSVICTFSIGVYTELIFERLLQATGRTVHSMIIQLIGAVINIIMDPIMIFGYFGFPEMGVTGAAAATVLGQIIAAIVAVIINQKYNKDIHLSFRGFRPDWPVIRRIYAVGLPSIIMQGVGSVITYCMNLILISFTSTAAAVLGAYFKLQSFFFMPVFGMNNAIIPIVAYNYGARRKSRIIKTLKLSIIYATAIMLIGMAAFIFIPDKLLMIFDASDQMLEIGSHAFRIISLHFTFAGFCIVSGSVFQALGNGMYSLITSLGRQVIILLPAAYIFSRLFGLDGVWWAYPCAEIMSAFLCVVMLIKINNKVLRHLPD